MSLRTHEPAARTMQEATRRATARLDRFLSAAVAALALVVYVRTLAPGMVAVLDTPMFQFIGRVLGVPHNPGYPLYVLLTHAFSYLPIGTLPYRINLFSALAGALAVALAYLVARRLGCRPVVSVAVAMGLAFGHVFWSQAVIAEVYTLHAVLVAGLLLALLAWGETGRPGLFFAAVGLVAAGLAHHTTIAGFVPAAAAYALATNHRFVLRWKTIGRSAAILAAGLLPYGFILLRSRQPGVYLESRATSLPELVDVMLARQFQNRLFAFDWITIAIERVPLVAGILAEELTIPVLIASLWGAGWLLIRRFDRALLLLVGCGAVTGFAVVYRVVDTPVFLIPAMLVLWLVAGVGLERMIRLVDRWRPVAAIAGLAVLAVPAWFLTHNFAAADRSRDTAAARHFAALFDALPDRTLLVREDFLVDRMVMFKLLADEAARGRPVALAPRDAAVLHRQSERGFSVLAFNKSARRLRHDGMGFGFRPMRLLDGTLADGLRWLPDGAVVGIAIPSSHVAGFSAAGNASLAVIGAPQVPAVGAGTTLAVLGVRGARRGARLQESDRDVHMAVAARRPIGDTGQVAPSTIEIRASAHDAAIRQGSRDIVRTSDGVALAIWSPDGRLTHAVVLEAEDDYRVPIPAGPLSVYPLQDRWPQQPLTVGEWTDVAARLQTGSVILRAPPFGAAVLYVGDRAPLAPRAIDRSSGQTGVGVAAFEAGSDVLRAALDGDGLDPTALAGAAHVYRIEVTALGGERASALVSLGGVPALGVGRLLATRPEAAGSIVQVDIDGLLRRTDRRSEVLLMSRDDQAQLTGAGWSPVDWDEVGPYRWMTATESRLVLPVGLDETGVIGVQALLDDPDGPGRVGLLLNGTELPMLAVRPGWDAYEWRLPAGLLRPGVNEVAVVVDRLSAQARGLAVAEIRVLDATPK